MKTGKIGVSDIVQAFERMAVGTRVVDSVVFMEMLAEAIERHDTSKDKVPGQHYVEMPAAALGTVSAGVGRHTHQPEDYVVRAWRGEAGLYLRRSFAAACTNLAVVVYTRDAYRADPQVTTERFLTAFPDELTTHTIVAVLASAGPRPPVSPHRFVMNLAGGNREYDLVTLAQQQTQQHHQGDLAGCLVDQIGRLRRLAGEVMEYTREWCVVAD